VRLPPIFFVCGAFGSGKSTLAPLVAESLPECYVLDVDWLMEPLIALSHRDPYEEAESWPALGDVWLAIIDSAWPHRPFHSSIFALRTT
jgi:predicted kinase